MGTSTHDERTVLVTGANSGIGLAAAVRAAAAGFRVVGTVRSEAKAAVLHEAAEAAGVEVASDLLDVSDTDGCAEVIERHRPWGLVNNAGFPVIGAVEDVVDDEARAVFEVMTLAPMRLARLALPHMRAAGGGRIVNVSSVYGFTTTPFSGWYQGTKHALEALSDALRMEVAADGIQVVLVQPGGFRTGIWAENDAGAERRAGSRYAEGYRRSLALTHRFLPIMGEPDGAAKMIVGALTTRSPRARYLAGNDAWVIALVDRVALTSVKDRLTRLTLGL
ncbi:MAG: SDR family NAD(P)-dependent oxidoreductase [Acidimicrobiales bacterium]|jgi:NAD(P)-dependent dehydrogenase (short-subunit alcohol dehydrogenase family)|nr:SDR family NAD(P)-dependent oxidoreductase [Acidimicrobiales bacterium]